MMPATAKTSAAPKKKLLSAKLCASISYGALCELWKAERGFWNYSLYAIYSATHSLGTLYLRPIQKVNGTSAYESMPTSSGSALIVSF